jgi:transposase
MKKQRMQYAPEEKVAILRRHLPEKEPISKLCDEMGLQPTVFYRWQKEFFENGAAAFEQKRPTNHSADQERIAYLQKKIQTKDEVLAELMAEHVAPKKMGLGNSDRELGSARYAGSDRGFRPALVGEDRDQRRAVH